MAAVAAAFKKSLTLSPSVSSNAPLCDLWALPRSLDYFSDDDDHPSCRVFSLSPCSHSRVKPAIIRQVLADEIDDGQSSNLLPKIQKQQDERWKKKVMTR